MSDAIHWDKEKIDKLHKIINYTLRKHGVNDCRTFCKADIRQDIVHNALVTPDFFDSYIFMRVKRRMYDAIRKYTGRGKVTNMNIFSLSENNYDLEMPVYSKTRHRADVLMMKHVVNSSRLNDVKKKMFVEYYEKDRTLKDIGFTIGLTESRVCQIVRELNEFIRRKYKNMKEV